MVESKRFLTKPLSLYALAYFISYIAMFYYVYTQNVEHMSPASWRVMVLFTVIVAIFASLAPAIARQRSNDIRIGNEINACYFSPIISFFIISLYYIFRSFYFWSLEFNNLDLIYLVTAYLIISPIFSIGYAAIQSD